jgi:hypothetical protein
VTQPRARAWRLPAWLAAISFWGGLFAWVAGGASGCKRHGAATPDEAFQTLERAVAAGDAATFYDCLTVATQKSIEGAWREEQLQRTIIQAKYPEAEAGPALARLDAAAADDPRGYFVRLSKERKLVEAFRKRLGSVSGPVKHKDDGPRAMWLARQDGMPFHFVRDGAGWSFSELESEWALEREHATHAVKTVRDNAALYEKAGTK